MNFANKVVLITGGSRGIGKAIALKLASEGASVAIAAKSVQEHPRLEGTIFSAASEINAVRSNSAFAFELDVRNEQAVHSVVQQVAEKLGGIDILVNNASAINLSSIEELDIKRFDLMNNINVRGTFVMSQACIPFLKKSENPHILTLSPPIDLKPKWFGRHTAYTMSKYGMSMVMMGLSQELKKYKIAANALWPKTTIATAAIQNLLGGNEIMKKSRTPAIVAEAAACILARSSTECTGNFFIDEAVLQSEGISDLEKYAVTPGSPLMPDLFL